MSISFGKQLFDLVDANDIVVGVGTEEDAIARNLFTRSVHIFLLDRQGKLLVCKRASSKLTYPGQITSSAGGHVEKGESYFEAAEREFQEELGVRVNIQDAGRFDVISEHERAIHHLFVGEYVGSPDLIKADPVEIDSLIWRDLKGLEDDAGQSPERYAYPFRQALEHYLAWLAN